jgi:DNA-binding transcriptional MerR regulator
MKSYISTVDIARSVGVHPNTVRLYEAWGLIPVAKRSEKGYRHYTPFYVDQMKLARLAMADPWPGRAIRHSSILIVKTSAKGQICLALEIARKHLEFVHCEQADSNMAAMVVEAWAQGHSFNENVAVPLAIGQVAVLINVTIDMLRNWERDGLICVPRRKNGYRYYNNLEISRLRIIRMLRHAGYSTMAILRMLHRLDGGEAIDIRHVLDTPLPEDDLGHATDHWLSTLNEAEKRARLILEILKDMQMIYPDQGAVISTFGESGEME